MSSTSNTTQVFSVTKCDVKSKVDENPKVIAKKQRVPCRKYQITDNNIRARLVNKMLESSITIRQVALIPYMQIGSRRA